MKNLVRRLSDTNTIVRYLVGDDRALFAKAKDFFDALIETVGGYT